MLDTLARRIGYEFADPGLLRRAMAHRSWVAETTGEASNERLEFLGDAVLGWVVADIVFQRFADLPEGALTDLRKSVVNATALADVARELGIGDHLLLGKGEDAAGGRHKPSILSDACEAVLGAIYLDGGAESAYSFVERFIAPRIEAAATSLDRLDHKTALQELAARLGLGVPEYRLRSEGPDHAKRFFAQVEIGGRLRGEGVGGSKKAAEQLAAAIACDALSDADGASG